MLGSLQQLDGRWASWPPVLELHYASDPLLEQLVSVSDMVGLVSIV